MASDEFNKKLDEYYARLAQGKSSKRPKKRRRAMTRKEFEEAVMKELGTGKLAAILAQRKSKLEDK